MDPLQTHPISIDELATRDLPLGSVQPRGWYRDILRCQADNLTGCLGEHWVPASRFSAWLGGSGDRGDQGPSYLDGLVPLAHLLRDESLATLARPWIDHALDFQESNGDFGPTGSDDRWPRMVMLKALMQHQEATGDPRVIPFMDRYAAFLEASLDERPLRSRAQARGGELILWLSWMYRQESDERYLQLADSVYAQTLDWNGYFNDLPYTRAAAFYFTARADMAQSPQGLFTHGVNVTAGLKTATLYSARSRDRAQRESIRKGVESLLRHHGVVTRLFTGDRHLGGRSPSRGTELCSVVEYMYSLESALGFFTDTWAADTLEMIAFNALPAAITPDFRGHQHLQQANQVLVTRDEREWFNTDGSSNLFGLEPEHGCCTANLHQGWPKLASALWRSTRDAGLAACVYAPGVVETSLPGGRRVRIETITDYPFSETILLRVETESPTRFPLGLRIPGWCDTASVRTTRGVETDLPTGSWITIDRVWSTGDTVELTLPMRVRVTWWHKASAGIELGPLVMALKITEQWSSVGGYAPFPTWSVTPMSPWNYALAIDTAAPGRGFELSRTTIGQGFSFAQSNAPVTLRARARRVPSWTLSNNSAADPPQSPLPHGMLDGVESEVELIPYAFARLRVSQFPWYRSS